MNATPVAEGVPVYTAGDQLWVASSSQSAIMLNLTDPSGSLFSQATVGPMASVLLYTFSASDQAGNWTLQSGSPSLGSFDTQIPLVNPVPAPVALTGSKLKSGGALAMNFTVASPRAYDIGACVTGSDLPSTVTVPVPAGLGPATLQLVLSREGVSVTQQGQVTSPFVFWLELHHDYSYVVASDSELLTRDVLAAQSASIPLRSGITNTTSVSLQTDVQMRVGRYTLRAFFEGSQGLSAFETQVLLQNDSSWVSLQDCSAFSSSLASSFSLTAPLAGPTSQWPREVYVMYRDSGIEMLSTSPVQAGPAAVEVLTSPWGSPFTHADITLVPNANVSGFIFAGGMVYITGSAFPIQLEVSLAGGGLNETGSIQITAPYSIGSMSIGAAEVVVTTLRAGVPVSGAVVALKYENNTVASVSSSGGEATFFIAPGEYDAVGSLGGVTRMVTISAQAGLRANATIELGTNTGAMASDVLIATGGAGAIAAVCAWVIVLRRKTHGEM